MVMNKYERLLGIKGQQAPVPEHILLDIPEDCRDAQLINRAARRRLKQLDRFAMSPEAEIVDLSQQLMNEIAQARNKLLAALQTTTQPLSSKASTQGQPAKPHQSTSSAKRKGQVSQSQSKSIPPNAPAATVQRSSKHRDRSTEPTAARFVITAPMLLAAAGIVLLVCVLCVAGATVLILSAENPESNTAEILEPTIDPNQLAYDDARAEFIQLLSLPATDRMLASDPDRLVNLFHYIHLVDKSNQLQRRTQVYNNAINEIKTFQAPSSATEIKSPALSAQQLHRYHLLYLDQEISKPMYLSLINFHQRDVDDLNPIEEEKLAAFIKFARSSQQPDQLSKKIAQIEQQWKGASSAQLNKVKSLLSSMKENQSKNDWRAAGELAQEVLALAPHHAQAQQAYTKFQREAEILSLAKLARLAIAELNESQAREHIQNLEKKSPAHTSLMELQTELERLRELNQWVAQAHGLLAKKGISETEMRSVRAEIVKRYEEHPVLDLIDQRLQLIGDQKRPYIKSITEKRIVLKQAPTAIFLDQQNRLYISFEQGGLAVLDMSAKPVTIQRHPKFKAILTDSMVVNQQGLIIGRSPHGPELYLYNPNTHKHALLVGDEISLSNNGSHVALYQMSQLHLYDLTLEALKASSFYIGNKDIDKMAVSNDGQWIAISEKQDNTDSIEIYSVEKDYKVTETIRVGSHGGWRAHVSKLDFSSLDQPHLIYSSHSGSIKEGRTFQITLDETATGSHSSRERRLGHSHQYRVHPSSHTISVPDANGRLFLRELLADPRADLKQVAQYDNPQADAKSIHLATVSANRKNIIHGLTSAQSDGTYILHRQRNTAPVSKPSSSPPQNAITKNNKSSTSETTRQPSPDTNKVTESETATVKNETPTEKAERQFHDKHGKKYAEVLKGNDKDRHLMIRILYREADNNKNDLALKLLCLDKADELMDVSSENRSLRNMISKLRDQLLTEPQKQGNFAERFNQEFGEKYKKAQLSALYDDINKIWEDDKINIYYRQYAVNKIIELYEEQSVSNVTLLRLKLIAKKLEEKIKQQ